MAEKSILIVDDEEFLRDALGYEFEKKGLRVFLAADVPQALEVFNANKIDLILSDYKMPKGSGVDLYQKVSSLNSSQNKLKFVLLTGFADVTEGQALEMGIRKVISKPFDRKSLVTSIMSLINEESSDSESR